MNVEIDDNSGFCFGVTTAIQKAEEELRSSIHLYCLGDIVHNGRECERLQSLGLDTVDFNQFQNLHDTSILFRAHGEPPKTYEVAAQNNVRIIDATCPVVLNLQRRIKAEYNADLDHKIQIVIYGKLGHAEVVGLVGQTHGQAIVIEKISDLDKLDYNSDISLYSQTTQSVSGFQEIVDNIRERMKHTNASFRYYDTICRQVANRMPNLCDFARKHEVVVFVCGKKSSNGRVLYKECQNVNPKTYFVEKPEDINITWFQGVESVGICGATSTPKWLMEDCKAEIEKINHINN